MGATVVVDFIQLASDDDDDHCAKKLFTWCQYNYVQQISNQEVFL